MATRSHCRAGYNWHWGALQAGCAQQSGSVDPRVALQGVNYTTTPGARPGHLSPRGGHNPGASSGGRHEPGAGQQSKRDPGGGKRVEWAGRRLFWPQWHRPTMDTWCPALLPVSGKKRRQMGISPRAPTQMQPYCSIRVEGCRGINGFKLIRRMSGSSC